MALMGKVAHVWLSYTDVTWGNLDSFWIFNGTMKFFKFFLQSYNF